MAVDLSNLEAHSSDYHFLPHSSPSEYKAQDLNEDVDEHSQFQDTVAFDSPLVENRALYLDLDTEPLDDCVPACEYEEEMVLDSEDEGINGSRLVSVPVASLVNKTDKRIEEYGSNQKKLNLPRELLEDGASKFESSTSEKCCAGNEVLVTTCGNFNGEIDMSVGSLCDRELVNLNDIGTPTPGEFSQAAALGFVDHFVSINNVELPQGNDCRKTVREKSPPVSSKKGPQSLARRINLWTQIEEKGKFEWVDNDPHEESCKHRYGNSKGKEKRGIPSFPKEVTSSTYLVPGLAADCSKDGSSMAQVSEVRNDMNSVTELESNGIGGDNFDIYEIGLDTQIAAEAIEALAYGPPVDFSSADACQALEETVDDSLRSVTKKKTHLKHPPLKSACSDLGGILDSAKRKKRSDRKFRGETSISSSKESQIQEFNSELATLRPIKRSKLFADGETQFCDSNSANASESSGRRSMKPTEQRNAKEALGRNNFTVSGNNMNSIMSVEHMPHVKEQSQGQCVKFSLATHQNIHLEPGVSLSSKDQSSNPEEKMNHIMEHDIPVYRRKRSGLNGNASKVSSVRRTSSKLSHSIVGARNSKLTSFSDLDLWSYSRGKRTSRIVHKHSSGTNDLNAPLNSHYQERATGNGNMKVRSQSPTCTRPNIFRHSPINDSKGSLSGKNFDKRTSPGSISECGSSVTKTKSPICLPVVSGLGQTGEPNDTDSNSLAVDEKNNMESSNRSFEPSGSKYTTMISSKMSRKVAPSNYMCFEYHKKPCNKNVPKTYLLKELVNLGSPKPTPEIGWKELRRRKDMAHVHILFSQHLDDDTIKQQKKVAARLGISIASCSMDATHFIADKFARTKNMLEAIALGKPVVTHLWLESCGQANCFIDERNYILRDSKKEKEFGFSMPVSLARASQHPLLKDHRVLVTSTIKPDKEMITNLVKAAQGQPVENDQICALKAKNISNDLLILSCTEDHSICRPFLEKGVAAYSSELLLNGIVTQKLDYKRYQLFTNDVKKNFS
ncbi:hypothetical protein UlMin_031326 [Ulmus minor]